MGHLSEPRQAVIQRKQIEQLFNSYKFSALGSMLVALTVVLIIGPQSDQQLAWSWFAIISLITAIRWFSSASYQRRTQDDGPIKAWKSRFSLGAYSAALAWGLSIWMFYPLESTEYQVLMILALSGVSAGAIAILSYNKFILTSYLLIILVCIESRLLIDGGQFAYQLAFLILLYFVFIIRGGRDIGSNYLELLNLRQDTEEHNLTLLSTTEQVARIGYWQWDMQSDELELSSNLASMCGFSDRCISMQACLDKVHEDDKNRVEMVIESVIESGEDGSVEYRLHDAEGCNWIIMNQVIKRINDASGKQFLLGTVQDISVIKSAEQKIFDMAYYDELTGLANRGHFRQHLIEQIKHASRNNLQIALLYLDLDGFKEINDTFGHEQGDYFLRSFSQKLKRQVRDEDLIARLGGDEFCMILAELKDGVDIAQTAERCLALKNEPVEIENQSISAMMSIGIAIYPQDGEDVDALLRAADAAMYSAKRKGKHQFAYYNPQMTEDAAKRLELESDLQKALLNQEFKLVYQPKVSLITGQVTGVEALIRWHHPRQGLVPPDEFISAAERNGLINEIGEWVMEQACYQQQLWKKQGIQLEMAVNISSSHFSSDKFIDKVMQVKQKYDIGHRELEIEITESLSRDPMQHIEISRELRSAGIKVAIDDFGTGYSSLSVLRTLEADTLKVDRAFIQHLPADRTSALMVKAITSMAIGLGFDVVAEGVETEEQARFLHEMGNPFVQGYLFSRPVDPEQIPELVKTCSYEPASLQQELPHSQVLLEESV